MSKQILLVHGGHTGAWEWNSVITELKSRGVKATAIDMPTRQRGKTLADDEQAVRNALTKCEGPVVLVGHSYSGAVITAASAGNERVAHLVYAAAVLPEEGQSVASSVRGELQVEGPISPDSTDDWVAMEPDTARIRIYNDATDDQFESVRPQLGHLSSRVLTEVPSGFGWREHPSTYLVCTLDQTYTPEVQRRFASHTTFSIDIEAGHAPMLTKPVEVADAIVTAAND